MSPQIAKSLTGRSSRFLWREARTTRRAATYTPSAAPLKARSGHIVPLGDVAEIKVEAGPAQISRDKGSRRITVETNVAGRDTVGFVAEARTALDRELKLPAGYRAEWGGQFQHYTEAPGAPSPDAAFRAAEDRLRPVLMTALVAILGFVPMALSTAPGSEVQRPLATVVIGGLISSTLLTLLVLPTVYGLVRSRMRRW